MKNKIIIFVIIVLSIILMPKVKASEISFGSGAQLYLTSGTSTYLQIGDNVNSLPKLFSIPGQSTSYGGALTLYLSPASGVPGVTTDSTIYNYIYFKVCSNAPFEYRITNSSTNQSYIMTGNYQSYELGTTCSTSNYTGTMKLVGIPIGKWYLNDVSEQFEVASYFTMYNSDRYTNYTTIYQIFLSDTDLLQTYRDRDALNNKLNDINTAITNMQNSINNNANTNAQNIINNQNSNAQQAHNDSVNTQNTIKDDSIDNPNSSINTIKNSLATNGVITSLVVLPVTLYQSILNSVNGTCSSFSLGSLYGTNLTIPCINVSNYVGATLWGSIDVIISGIFVYMISRKMVKVFNQLSSLKEGDILDG